MRSVIREVISSMSAFEASYWDAQDIDKQSKATGSSSVFTFTHAREIPTRTVDAVSQTQNEEINGGRGGAGAFFSSPGVSLVALGIRHWTVNLVQILCFGSPSFDFRDPAQVALL